MAVRPDARVRCAIYTRKSTEEGLNQSFNTLDAQREAAEAFVNSQRHEGWEALAQKYDDGGYTGANMDRPALKRLLADIQSGAVNCVVVYKVDRLSRSLLDFARIMEIFDKHGATFVSVTQAFNTTSSMGRLTLVRWDIDRDIMRGRDFEMDHKLLPDSISGIQQLEFLDTKEARLLSQIQGRTYANMFGLVERFINCKVLELGQNYCTGDQVALEAMVRFSDEELKHQELFRRIERMIAAKMPPGYRFVPQPNEVANAVLSKSTWAVLGLTLMIELFTQTHYLKSIQPDQECSALYKDVFLYHWKEESQHARLDELEWTRENAALSSGERDRAVNDMIELVAAVDGIVRAQSGADVDYFLSVSGAAFIEENVGRLYAETLAAYRWQYILSGAAEPRFQKVLRSMITADQLERIETALAPLTGSATVQA